MATVNPLVHGYIRMEEPDETEIALLCKDIGSYCSLRGYRLDSIFIDRGVSDDVFARMGFLDLLDAVRLTHAHGVVVPGLDHLSSEAFILDALQRMVAEAGAALYVVYEPNDGSQIAMNGRDLGPAPGAPS